MKNYHSYKKIHLGASDIASLILRTPGQMEALNFGEDGDYWAYLVDEEAEISEYYEKVFTANYWLKIYDDEALTFNKHIFDNEEIVVYRAGSFGCIIQIRKKVDAGR